MSVFPSTALCGKESYLSHLWPGTKCIKQVEKMMQEGKNASTYAEMLVVMRAKSY